jgi:uncharacterized protein (TIGR03437 family)
VRLILLTLLAATFSWAQQCTSVTLNPSLAHYTPAAGNGTFAVTAIPSNCIRTPVSSADWLTISFGNNSTPGSVGYTVATNTIGLSRTATITLASATFTVTQDAAPCTFSLVPSGISATTAGGSFMFAVATNCQWTASSNADWITIAAPSSAITGNGTVSYSIATNSAPQSRSGVISINSTGISSPLSFNVIQSGIACSYTLSPTSLSFTAAGGPGSIALTTNTGCQWTIVNPAAWISNLPVPSTGPATINFSVAPNTTSASRSTSLTIAGQQAAITQAGQGIVFSAASVANGASFQSGGIAPGEIITIFGSGLGPTAGATLQLNATNTAITNNLAGTQVLFDGLPSPMIYASATQVSAIVPYSLAGSVATAMQIAVQGVRSASVPVQVVQASPAIFTIPSKGTGQGAVLNQDYTVNSAANPAPIGSVLQIFATGGGAVTPSVADGLLTATPLPINVLKVSATIGGLPAQVLFSGGAPGLVSGVLQVNVLIPVGVTPGPAVALAIQAGTIAAPAGVTVAIQ